MNAAEKCMETKGASAAGPFRITNDGGDLCKKGDRTAKRPVSCAFIAAHGPSSSFRHALCALLHHGDDMPDAVPAVVPEPAVDDRHQPADIKRQDVFPLSGGHMEAVQNGGEHIVV